MVADTNRVGVGASWGFNRAWGRNSCSAICLHTFLMQKIYKSILVLIAGFCGLHLIFIENTIVFLCIAIIVLLLSAFSEKAAVVIEKSWLWFGERL